jgi:hypothetical protein
MHPRQNAVQLGFAEVGNHPPDAGIDQREHLGAGVRVSALGKRQVGYACVERRAHYAVVEVVLRVGDGRGTRAALCGERIKRSDGVLRLQVLCLRPRHVGVGSGQRCFAGG